MAKRILPDQAYLHECLAYAPDSGILTWKDRPLAHFERPDGKYPAWRIRKAWQGRFLGKPVGTIAVAKSGLLYLQVGIENCHFRAHRIIWKMVTGDDPGDEIDHEDGDGLNNRWTNLRPASHAQNMHNNGGWRRHELPKGVKPMRGRFQARICVNYVVTHLGTFDTPEGAHAAYCEAAERLHGEFATPGARTECSPATIAAPSDPGD